MNKDLKTKKDLINSAISIIKKSSEINDEYNIACFTLSQLLSKVDLEVLGQLVEGPVLDGDIISSSNRNYLLELGLAYRIVIKRMEGYSSATSLGLRVYNYSLLDNVIKEKMTFSKAMDLLKINNLPNDFTDWDLADINGLTIAHQAAFYGRLPSNFDNWSLKDKNGWTVAHSAAISGSLPPNFPNLDWKNNKGWTVAHEMATNGYLPHNFNNWDLVDNYGITVKNIYDQYLVKKA